MLSDGNVVLNVWSSGKQKNLSELQKTKSVYKKKSCTQRSMCDNKHQSLCVILSEI